MLRLSDTTIVFTYYCKGSIRRKYLQFCLESIFGFNNPHKIPILVIDGSPSEETIENKKLFENLTCVDYKCDSTVNPFGRCLPYLRKIKTPYILRLIEDFIFVNFKSVIDYTLIKDMELLEKRSDITAIYYPNIPDKTFRIENSRFFFKPNNYNCKYLEYEGNISFYNFYHITKESYPFPFVHYLYNAYACTTNNFLYRTDFFVRHWNYINKMYNSFVDAETATFSHPIFRFLRANKSTRLMGRILENIIFGRSIIKKIVVTKTSEKMFPLHIGFFSTDITDFKELDGLEKVAGIQGVGYMNKNLMVFKNINSLEKLMFIPVNDNNTQ